MRILRRRGVTDLTVVTPQKAEFDCPPCATYVRYGCTLRTKGVEVPRGFEGTFCGSAVVRLRHAFNSTWIFLWV